jgi:DNA-binding response OmpR family regulator
MLPSTETGGPRILIVDDQRSNVRLLEQTLRRAGFTQVMSTLVSREVVALHLQHRYRLILLDLQMPEMDGFAVMAELRGIQRTNPVSVMVISADQTQTDAAMRAGADSFLSKPFRLSDVVDRVQLMLKSSSSDSAIAGEDDASLSASSAPLR